MTAGTTLLSAALTLVMPAVAVVGPRGAAADPADTTGAGWTTSSLDLDVKVHPQEGRLTIRADLVVRLEGFPSSEAITLVMNSRDTIMGFDSLDAGIGTVASLNAAVPFRQATRAARVKLPSAATRGDEVRIRVYASSRTTIPQFTLAADIALASWVTVWYPIPLPVTGRSLSVAVKAPGSTRFDLPGGWRAVGNGSRVGMEERGGRTYERWVTDQPLARSFVAAPYRVFRGDANGRSVELFLLTVDEAEARKQSTTLAGAIAALEKRFGPYPTGGYAIAEVPAWVPGFLAASEQGFMMAKPETFAVPGGNIPLFAHEAAHGYWGNLLTSSGPGSSFLSESASQYGAVIALEEMLGRNTAVDFLKFSREGYIPLQSAVGFFEVVRRGADSVAIADMENLDGMAKRIVVDSKGPWVYQMLRELVGDDIFFATLRSYLSNHAAGTSTLDRFRETFAAAAPAQDVRGFFEQWLDRTGAPRFEVEWRDAGAEVEVTLRQIQEGDAYAVRAEILVRGSEGPGEIHSVRIDAKEQTVRLPAPRGASEVVFDPEFKIFRWDASYQR